jgi:hypothetical protein
MRRVSFVGGHLHKAKTQPHAVGDQVVGKAQFLRGFLFQCTYESIRESQERKVKQGSSSRPVRPCAKNYGIIEQTVDGAAGFDGSVPSSGVKSISTA